MNLFHVYIERPSSPAPDAVATLARAIADRYGIPATDLEARLAGGRFRVKGNVDRATADSYAHDLGRLGAVCTIAAAEVATPPSTTTPAVSLPRVERAPAPPPRPAPARWPPDVEVAQELGALSGEFPLTLSTLDGATEDEARASRKIKLPASFAPPAEPATSASRTVPLPASFGPGPGPAPEPSGDDVDLGDDDGPPDVFDPFAPPEAQANAPELMLAVERKDERKRATVSEAPSGPPAAPIAAAAAEAPRAPTGAGWKAALRDDGKRLIAGAVLAVLIGAVPALLIGGARERAAFAQLDGELDQRQAEIRTREGWDGLDRVRATFADRKRAERQSIAITSLMIWAALGGGFTWLWFRKIDWNRALA